MMFKQAMVGAVCLTLSWAVWVQAEVVVTTADGKGADTWVANDADRGTGRISGDSEDLDVRYNADPPRLRITILRFDLTGVSGDFSGTTLSLYDEDSPRSRTWTVYGLFNEDYDNWSEYETNYLNAPGFLESDYGTWESEEGAYQQLGTIDIVAGEATNVSDATELDLASLLEADTNGMVTLVIRFEDTNYGGTWSMPSKESTTADIYPTLTMPCAEMGTVTRASAPSPANREDDVYQAANLTWTAGAYAASHRLYFGTDFADVNNAAPEAFIAELNEPVYTPEQLLEFGVTYYWRVDEVNASGDDAVYPGSTWSFTVEPETYDLTVMEVTASSSEGEERAASNVIDGSGLSDDAHDNEPAGMWISDNSDTEPQIQFAFDRPYGLAEMKVWNYNGEYEGALGYGINEVIVETSLDAESWSVVEGITQFAQGTGYGGYALNNTFDLAGLKVQYVRFTALSNYSSLEINSVGLSEVQFTGIPLHARVPLPVNGAADVDLDQVLQWRAGRNAVEHRVYFSADSNAVVNRGGVTLLDTVADDELALTDIDLASTYSWAVDAVHEDIVVPGSLWSFSTPERIVIDDMESYTDTKGYRIFDAWQDGYGTDNDNGSQVGHSDPVYAELETVYAGSQSMPYYYDNTRGEDAAWAELDLEGQDWTVGGIGQLSLFFLGERDNIGGELYLEIDGERIVSNAALNSGIWSQWVIDLNTVNTDLTRVDSLILGVAGEDAVGLLYFDDIILYREAPIVGSDQTQDPGATGLELRYSFERNLDDSSAHGWDASAPYTVLYNESLQEGNLDLGDALSLDGIDVYVEAPASVGNLMAGLSDCTFSAWVSINVDSGVSWQRVFDFGTGTTDYLFLSPRGSTGNPPEFGILSSTSVSGVEQDVAAGEALSSGWHHLAVVIDEMALNLYVDGILAGTDVTDTLPQDVGVTTNNWLGRSQWETDGYYDGLLDEFTIYSRPLSMEEIRYLAGAR